MTPEDTEKLARIMEHPNRKILDAAYTVVLASEDKMPQPWEAIALFKHGQHADAWARWRHVNRTHDEVKAKLDLAVGIVVFKMHLLDQGVPAVGDKGMFDGIPQAKIFRECWGVVPQTGQPWDAIALFLEERHAHLWLEQNCDPLVYEVKRFLWQYAVEERERSHFEHAVEGATLN